MGSNAGGTPLDGKLALVTGAGTGIGVGIAEELARQGAAVALHYANSEEGARRKAAEIVASGGRAHIVQGDLSDVQVCQRVVDESAEFLGGIDILVNNSGWSLTEDFLETTPEVYDRVFAINVRASYFCAQQAVRWMLKRGGGNILNITSVQGYAGIPGNSAYSTTKGALMAFTRVLAVELAPMHVRVNAIGPGVIEVQRYHREFADYTSEYGASLVPWGRVGMPSDVAKAAAFLVSDAADFITGQVLFVDGGSTSVLAIPRVRRK